MLTIIITAYKEPETVKKAIQVFLDENIKQPYEILAIAPDKETADSIKPFTKINKKIKYLKDPGKGKPTALNLAFKKAKGNILILTDGDVLISKGAVKELLKPLNNRDVGAVSGHPIPINKKDTMLGFWAHLLTEVGAHKRRLELQQKQAFIVCSGYLMAIRNSIIKSIPTESLADDAVISNLIYSKGYQIRYAPNALVNVKFPTTFSDWIKQKRRSAGGYSQLPKLLGIKDEMRSFTKESSKISWALNYPKTLKEFWWTFLLILARLYLWLLIFIDVNIKRKSLKETWIRIETTK
jgi:cellulose synthase/poly-beta-1,6-N-acetylglucosamine synthase-like glycosyltransferase